MPRPIIPSPAFMGKPVAVAQDGAVDPTLVDKDLPRGYLSPSSVGLYLSCPYAFYLRYVENVAELTASQQVVGKTIHTVLQVNAIQKVKSGHNLAAKDLIAMWDDLWLKSHPTIDSWMDEESPNSIAAFGRTLVQTFAESPYSALQARTKEDIEKPFRVLIGTVPVVGSIDIIVDRDYPTVVDYKVSKTGHSESEAASSIQLGTYAMATGINSVAYCSIVKTKVPKVVFSEAIRTPKSLGKVANVYKATSDAIKKGVFPYTDPAGWKCAAKYCGAWHACPQGGKY